MDKSIIISCPHCSKYSIIESLNCCIFRCGYIKSKNEQIPPHSTKSYVDILKANDDIVGGCGMPFKIELVDGQYIASACEWI